MSNNLEKIVEKKVCRHCQTKFYITDKDLEFYEKVSPIFKIPHTSPLLTGEGKEKSFSRKEKDLGWGLKEIKYLIPTPTLCPNCRQQRRLSFRNERKLYKRTCDATWKPIISIFSPDKPYKVYNHDFWWSDKWNPLDYWREFDFSRSFFEQFYELVKEVPKISLVVWFNENSEYVNFAWHHKNCYLIFDSDFCEDSMFWNVLKHSKNLSDCSFSMNSEIMYECVDCDKCYNLKYCINSSNCSNSVFLFNCVNCKNCYWCTNLINKEYYIYNKTYTKEEYEKKIKEINIWNYNTNSQEKQKFINTIKKSKVKSTKVLNSENYTWNYISDSKNVFESFDIWNWEDCKFIDTVYTIKDSYDISSFWEWIEKSYECETVWINVYNILFSFSVINATNVSYSQFCWSVKDCFWCAWLHSNQQYCILNKQYTKEEYEKLVPKIIEHMMSTSLIKEASEWKKQGDFVSEWGDFFPSYVSPFWYNETVANEYFQLSRDYVLDCHSELVSESSKCYDILNDFGLNPEWQSTFQHWQIFNRSDYEQEFPKVDKIIPANKLPEDIKQIPDDILNRAIECEITKKPFRIIMQELDFYRKHNLPIPRRHPDQRHLDRMNLRNPRKLFDRKCDKCKKDITTTYSPERSEIVYCEDCYNNEIY